MDIHINAVLVTFIIFALKLISVLFICSFLDDRKKHGANFAVSWMIFYLYEIALMFVLSFIKRLYALELSILWGISLIAVGILRVCRKKIKRGQPFPINFSDIMPLTIMIAFCVYCMARSFLYFDSTPDAGTYGMPRIFLFSTQGSLFINMGTLAKNIFVNEWNGELNAVFYRVLTQDNVTIPFANIETYFYAMVSFVFLGKELFREKKYGVYWSYVVMFLPVVVFLAFTCKGDCLGMVAFPIFVLILLSYWKEEKKEGENHLGLLYGAIAGGALATGARITLVPAVGFIMLILLADLVIQKKYQRIGRLLVSSVVAYIIGWGRYILNLVYYGNPFERVDAGNERIAPSIQRFFTSLSKYMEDIVFGENIFTHEGVMWALNADAGILGICVIIASALGLGWLIYRFMSRRELLGKYWREILTAAVILFVIGFMLCSMDYYTWSFRYFAPYFICILVILMYLLNFICSRKVLCICWGIVIALGTINAYSVISMTTLTGEVTGDTWRNMLKKEELSRRMAFHEWLVENPEGENDINDFYDDMRENKKVLVCNNIDQMISWCWGDNAANHVTICKPEKFEEYYKNDEWDVVVVSNLIDVGQLILSPILYQHFEPFYLNFDVYIRKEVYEGAFRAEEYCAKKASIGMTEFDGEYCWLGQRAEIPIYMEQHTQGVQIVYAAGVDLKPVHDKDLPQVCIYVNDQKIGTYDVEYTGEYTIPIPQKYFEQPGVYMFRFETNATVAEHMSIRLKEIVPAAKLSEKGI